MPHVLRALAPSDAAALRELRLEALTDSPDAYLSSREEEHAWPVEEFAARLAAHADDPAHGVLGAFDGERLVGMVGFFRLPHQKTRHKAGIWGMYVSPAARAQGLGRALMTAAMRRLASAGGIEQIQLAVAEPQRVARALYLRLGFEPFGIERRSIKDGPRYVDEEHMVYWVVAPLRT